MDALRIFTEDEASAHFDYMAYFVALDNPTSSARTWDALGKEAEGTRASDGLSNSPLLAP